jgi:hypothetical protein
MDAFCARPTLMLHRRAGVRLDSCGLTPGKPRHAVA